jgi:hypothetical protein
MPELDAKTNAVAIQTLEVENEGCGRDYKVSELSKPTFAE